MYTESWNKQKRKLDSYFKDESMTGKKQIRIYIIGTEQHVWLKNLSALCNRVHDTYMIETNFISNADLVVHTGGADVSPRFYGELEKSKYTNCSEDRDAQDLADYKFAVEKKIKLLGICRGSQWLTAMAGGKLIQDVTNHGNGHHILDWNNNIHWVTSTHHQMMYPFSMINSDYKLIASAQPKLSARYLNGDDEEITLCEHFVEPEVVYYTKIKALAIQCHPELMFDGGTEQKWFAKLVLTHIEKDDLTKEDTKGF